MSNYTRTGVKKLKDIIHELRARNNRLEKEIRLLREEMTNLMKPVRSRKPIKDPRKMTSEEWRLDFVRRFKESKNDSK